MELRNDPGQFLASLWVTLALFRPARLTAEVPRLP